MSEASRQVTRDALQRMHTERQVRDRRDTLDEAVAKAATAGNDQEVLNLLQNALSLSPSDAVLRARVDRAQDSVASAASDRFIALARSAEKTNRWEAAAGYWQRASAGRPEDPQLLLNAAEALLHGKTDYGRATDLARKASQLDPNNATPYVCLTKIFLAAGRTASARGAFENAKRISPSAPEVVALARQIKT